MQPVAFASSGGQVSGFSMPKAPGSSDKILELKAKGSTTRAAAGRQRPRQAIFAQPDTGEGVSAREVIEANVQDPSFTDEPETTESEMSEEPEMSKEPQRSRALPWLERPRGVDSLKGADYAIYLTVGDFGFDPLGFAEVGWGLNEGESTEDRDDRLYAYREAELKHGRLAMLAAVGWPLSELESSRLSKQLGLPSGLVSADDSGVGLAPSLLNGGLGRFTSSFWGVALFVGAYWEGIGVRRLKGRVREGQKRAPGDLGFDPLGLLPDKEMKVNRRRMFEQELTHGRTAMLAIVGFAIQEAITKVPVIYETPQFFSFENAFLAMADNNFLQLEHVQQNSLSITYNDNFGSYGWCPGLFQNSCSQTVRYATPCGVEEAASVQPMPIKNKDGISRLQPGKGVYMRVDYNVPEDTNDPTIITHTLCIKGHVPAGQSVSEKGAKSNALNDCMAPLAKVVEEKLGVAFKFCATVLGPETEAAVADPAVGTVILVENLQFNIEDEGKGVDADGNKIEAEAQKVTECVTAIRSMADSTSQHAHSYMVEQLDAFAKMLMTNSPEKPVLAILDSAQKERLGGKLLKVSDKSQLITDMMDKVIKLMIEGDVTYTFINVNDDVKIGSYLFGEEGAKIVPEIMEKAKRLGVEIVLPIDFVIKSKSKFGEDSQIKSADENASIPKGLMGSATTSAVNTAMMEEYATYRNGPLAMHPSPKYHMDMMHYIDVQKAAYQDGAKPKPVWKLAIENFQQQGAKIPLQFGEALGLIPRDTKLLPHSLNVHLSNAAVVKAELDREAAGNGVDAHPVSRALYDIGMQVLDALYEGRPIQRFWFLETIARVPYFSFVSMLHLYESFGWWRAAELRKVHNAQEWNEMHHLLIMESLGGNALWSDRFLAYHTAFVCYWAVNVVFLCSPQIAYQFMELLEAHAVDTYATFVEENRKHLAELPAPSIARSYYTEGDLYFFDDFQIEQAPGSRRPVCDTLLEVFMNICQDEGEHVKTMRACQDYVDDVDSCVVSPHAVSSECRSRWNQWAEDVNKRSEEMKGRGKVIMNMKKG
jgi:3-phosphoglycerate kinase